MTTCERDDDVSLRDWAFAQRLIRDVMEQEGKEGFSALYPQWRLVVRGFQALELEHLILNDASEKEMELHKEVLEELIKVGEVLQTLSQTLKPQELSMIHLDQEQISAHIQELRHNLRRWHSNLPKEELERIQRAIFGGTP